MKSMKGGAMDIKTGNQFIRVFDEGDFKELEIKQGKRPMTDIKSEVRLDRQGGFRLGNPYEKYQEEKRNAERKTVADFLREVKTQNFLKPRPILLNKNPGGEKPFGINGANVSGFGLSNDYLIRGGTIMSQKAENAIKQKLKKRVAQLNAQDQALKGEPLISQPDPSQLVEPSEAEIKLTELDFAFDDFITAIDVGNLDANIVKKIQDFFNLLSRTLFLIDTRQYPRINKYIEQLEIARDNIDIIMGRFEVNRPDLVAIGRDLKSRIDLIIPILKEYRERVINEPTQSRRKKLTGEIFKEFGLRRIGLMIERLPPVSTEETEEEELQEPEITLEIEEEDIPIPPGRRRSIPGFSPPQPIRIEEQFPGMEDPSTGESIVGLNTTAGGRIHEQLGNIRRVEGGRTVLDYDIIRSLFRLFTNQSATGFFNYSNYWVARNQYQGRDRKRRGLQDAVEAINFYFDGIVDFVPLVIPQLGSYDAQATNLRDQMRANLLRFNAFIAGQEEEQDA